jgi:hypothetical protein
MDKDSRLRQELLNEVKKKGLITEQKSEEGGIVNMVSKLLHSRIQTHIFHWQTNSQSSFAEHMALGGYYSEIGDKVDGIVESFQGKYGIVKGYKSENLENYESVKQLISYFEGLNDVIEVSRKSIKESYIQNQIDTIQELIFSTLYKLKFLK